MDGYAVQAASVAGATETNPIVLEVVGQVAAGYVFDGAVAPGTAVRIMTGAPIPEGADAIVPFEETDESGRGAPHGSGHEGGRVRVFKAAAPEANVRRAGGDVRQGDLVMPEGTILGPAHIGVLASVGRSSVLATRRPRVAILSTGDEVLEPGQERGPAQIYDSNSASIAALVQANGGIPVPLGIARDTIEDLTAKVRQGMEADLLVTAAGVSRGDFDIVKDVLAREGEIGFWTVNMRPGKPLAFGVLSNNGRRVPHIGLPGNPVSAMVTFELFGRAALQQMLGHPVQDRPIVRAITRDRIVMDDSRRFFARCTIVREDGGWVASLAGSQGSNVLTTMARSNGLVIVPEGSPNVEPGSEVNVLMLEWER
jgi:molybdopterin molybdotransferase